MQAKLRMIMKPLIGIINGMILAPHGRMGAHHRRPGCRCRWHSSGPCCCRRHLCPTSSPSEARRRETSEQCRCRRASWPRHWRRCRRLRRCSRLGRKREPNQLPARHASNRKKNREDEKKQPRKQITKTRIIINNAIEGEERLGTRANGGNRLSVFIELSGLGIPEIKGATDIG